MKKVKLTLEELRDIILHNTFRLIKEEKFEDDDDGLGLSDKEEKAFELPKTNDSTAEVQTQNFSDLNSTVKSIADKVGNTSILDNMILNVLEKGRFDKKFNYNTTSKTERNRNAFNYVTTVLATLYRSSDTSETQKKHIKDALWVAMFQPYAFTSVERGSGDTRASMLSNIIANKAGIFSLYTQKNQLQGEEYQESISNALMQAIDYSLEKAYNGSVAFPTFVVYAAADRLKNEVKKQARKGRFGGTTSLDEPLGTDGEEKDETQADRISGDMNTSGNDSEKEASKLFANSLKAFIEEKLAGKENYLEFFRLFSEGLNMTQISDDMGISKGNLAVIKLRTQNFINKFVENGELQNFIKEKTGMTVEFPNDKFTITIREPGKKEEEAEPVGFYKEDPQTGEPVKDPATGEPKLFMINTKVKPENAKYFDDYGKLAFGDKSDEEENEAPEDFGPDDKALTESFITKHLMKLVNKRIKKDFGNE